MSLIAMVFGALLIVLGGGLYALSDPRAATALIPAYFGIALVAIMLFRPAGLWPSAVRKRELEVAKQAAG